MEYEISLEQQIADNRLRPGLLIIVDPGSDWRYRLERVLSDERGPILQFERHPDGTPIRFDRWGNRFD